MTDTGTRPAQPAARRPFVARVRQAAPAPRPPRRTANGSGDRPGGTWGDDAPPGTDVLEHLRELVRQAPAALLVALLVALVVGLVRGSAEPVYRATATAVVEPGDAGDTGDPEGVARLAATFVAAGDDPAVLSTASAGTGWTAAEAAERIQVAIGEETGVIDVTVEGGSTAEARRVAGAVAPALQTAVRADRQAQQDDWVAGLTQQLAQVQAQQAAAGDGTADAARLAADVDVRLQQISRIQRAAPPGISQPSPAVADPDAVSPQPLRDASLAFLLTALVAAELGVLLAGRTGLTLRRSSARRLARRGRGSYHEVPRDPLGAASLLPLRGVVGDALAAGQQVVVLAGSGVGRAEAAALVLESGTGDLDELRSPVTVAPGGDGAAGLGAGGAGTGQVVTADLDEPWWRHVDASRLGLAVVVAPLAAPVRPLATEATSALAAAGASVHVVVLTVRPRPLA